MQKRVPFYNFYFVPPFVSWLLLFFYYYYYYILNFIECNAAKKSNYLYAHLYHCISEISFNLCLLFVVMGFLLSKQHRWSSTRTCISGTTIPRSKLQPSAAWSAFALGWNADRPNACQWENYWRSPSSTGYYSFLSGMCGMSKFICFIHEFQRVILANKHFVRGGFIPQYCTENMYE